MGILPMDHGLEARATSTGVCSEPPMKFDAPGRNTPLEPPSRGDNPEFLNLRIAPVRWGLADLR